MVTVEQLSVAVIVEAMVES